MKAIGEFVLLKKVGTLKKSKIITGGKKEDSFEFTTEIIGMGDCAKEKAETVGLKFGDEPVLSEFAAIQATEIVEELSDKIIAELIVHISDIVGVK